MAVIIWGLVCVASNPTPGVGAFSLVVVAGGTCVILIYSGGSFLSLILFLIYIGGMMVVFSYSVAFANSINPDGWGSGMAVSSFMIYSSGVIVPALFIMEWSFDGFWIPEISYWKGHAVHGGLSGVSVLYSVGGMLLIIAGWGLLLALFVVLNLARGFCLGGIRGGYVIKSMGKRVNISIKKRVVK